MKKSLIVIILVILLAGGGAFWFFTRDKSTAAQTLYSTTAVQKGTLATEVSGSGELDPATDEDITVDADDASKTIYSIDVSENSTVKKGDTLLTFTDGTTLTAPANGTITKVSAYEGDRVNAGKAVFHLTDYNNLNTVVQVDELDIPKIKKGQSVSVTVNAWSGKTFSGKVTSVAKTGTNTNGVSTFDVTVHLDKSSGLKPGMTATASIVIQKKSNVLYLPSGAVHQAGNQAYVYLSSNTAESQSESEGYGRRQGAAMDQKQGSRVEVKTGIHNDQSIEITSGLEEGQKVQLAAITRQNGTNGTNSSTNNGQNQSMMPGMNGGGQGFGSNGGQGLRTQMRNGGGNGQ